MKGVLSVEAGAVLFMAALAAALAVADRCAWIFFPAAGSLLAAAAALVGTLNRWKDGDVFSGPPPISVYGAAWPVLAVSVIALFAAAVCGAGGRR